MDEITVRISGTALNLARQMVADGTCASIDEAVGRALALASLHDSGDDATVSTWPDSFKDDLRAKLAEVDEDVRSGTFGPQAPALWAQVRELVTAQARASRQAT